MDRNVGSLEKLLKDQRKKSFLEMIREKWKSFKLNNLLQMITENIMGAFHLKNLVFNIMKQFIKTKT